MTSQKQALLYEFGLTEILLKFSSEVTSFEFKL